MHRLVSNILGRPQVPVTLTSADWAKFLGSTASSPPMMHPGSRIRANDLVLGEAEFILAYGVASLAIGDAVRIGGNFATTRTVAGVRGRIGISMAANTDTAALSWFCVEGQVPATVAAATAINTPLNMTATAGALDDAVVAGDGLSGAVSATAQSATVTTKVCNTVNGSVYLPVPDIEGLFVGLAVSGTGIAASTTISAIGYGGLMLGAQGPQPGFIQLNNAMTATGQVTITFATVATQIIAMLAEPFANGAL
jgi:hypothetical protein